MKPAALILFLFTAPAAVAQGLPQLSSNVLARLASRTNLPPYKAPNFSVTFTAMPTDAWLEVASDIRGPWTRTNNPYSQTNPLARVTLGRANWLQKFNLSWSNNVPTNAAWRIASVRVYQSSDLRGPGGFWTQNLPATNNCTLYALDNSPQHCSVEIQTDSGPIADVPNMSAPSDVCTFVPLTHLPTVSILITTNH